ncbi:hypothetical protein NKR23_g6007 [Pleurostoma richardsiae]|uniref:Late endosomal/lysosomal adaptor and MAPK and MTOR activator 1 n=1 Tax=Pleurostoma richardsiae TaxID=41990 RepID=A0AA38VPU9_9PEZI|nr:hypothetical protein NKR23_g6007 [Pleurostoma richardsiae]
MGICASCLGDRRRDVVDEDDESRLLFDDPNSMHYGSFEQQQMNGQDDLQETQREIEALQRVVARTSDNMVDIFDIAPQESSGTPRNAPAPFVFPGQEARLLKYQHLLSKLDSSEDDPTTAGARVDWFPPEDDHIEMQRSIPPVKEEAVEPLVGNFADAAAAMA